VAGTCEEVLVFDADVKDRPRGRGIPEGCCLGGGVEVTKDIFDAVDTLVFSERPGSVTERLRMTRKEGAAS
jgi:hypothetical protein